jgi:hypothetical protein
MTLFMSALLRPNVGLHWMVRIFAAGRCQAV